MIWPDFNELGDLPVGVYRAKIAEVIAHFGRGTAQRVTVTARLERIYELVRVSFGLIPRRALLTWKI